MLRDVSEFYSECVVVEAGAKKVMINLGQEIFWCGVVWVT